MKKPTLVALLLCATGVAHAQMYITTGDWGANGQLYTVNTTTGATSFVANLDVNGSASAPVSIVAMAYDSQNGTLYGVTRNNNNNNAHPATANVDPDSLVSINRTNGHVTVLANLSSAVASLAYDVLNNTLYTWSQVDADDNSNPTGPLGNIDFTTTPGSPTLNVFGDPGNVLPGGDAAIGVDASGTIWLAGAEGGDLYTVNPGVDPNSGSLGFYSTATNNNNMFNGPFGGAGGATITGMTIVGGTLYAIDSDKGGPPTATNLVTITMTGANAGLISTIPLNNPNSPAALPGNAQAIAFVPEPSAYAGMLGLASAAVALLRRRRVKA